MKELSIEQKAKAYDEALKVINECNPDENGFITIYPQEIFPELKESEDERYKRILHSITNKISLHLCDIFTEEEYQCFDAWSNAWLEKQGEQNPKFRIGDTIKKKSTGDIVTISEIDLKNKEYRLSNTGFIPFKYEYLWELVEQKSIELNERYIAKVFEEVGLSKVVRELSNDELTNALQSAMIELAEKQGEQKPVELREIYIADVFEKVGLAKCVRELVNDNLTKAIQDAMLELSKEQKPVEWSDKDKAIIESLIALCDDKIKTTEFTDVKEHAEKCKHWVEYLKDRVIPQQKPLEENKGNNGGISPNSEWSDEDETRLTNIIIMLKEGASLHFNKKEITKAVDFLKSLKDRYTWKPTEEQMYILKWVSDVFLKQSSIVEKSAADVLGSLYEQLKAL